MGVDNVQPMGYVSIRHRNHHSVPRNIQSYRKAAVRNGDVLSFRPRSKITPVSLGRNARKYPDHTSNQQARLTYTSAQIGTPFARLFK